MMKVEERMRGKALHGQTQEPSNNLAQYCLRSRLGIWAGRRSQSFTARPQQGVLWPIVGRQEPIDKTVSAVVARRENRTEWKWGSGLQDRNGREGA